MARFTMSGLERIRQEVAGMWVDMLPDPALLGRNCEVIITGMAPPQCGRFVNPETGEVLPHRPGRYPGEIVFVADRDGTLVMPQCNPQVERDDRDGDHRWGPWERRLLEFARWVIEQHTGTLEGCDIETKAIELGLMEAVEVEERCGEECECAATDNVPGTCYRSLIHGGDR